VLGEWDECLRLADAFIAECEAGVPHYHEGQVRLARAALRLARDDTDGARADDSRAVAHARETGSPQTLMPALGNALRLQLELGDVTLARERADELLSYYRRGRVGLYAYVDLAWGANELGRTSEVRAVLNGLRRSSRWIAPARALLDEDFVSAADLFGEMGATAEEALARSKAAKGLLAEGRRDDAETQMAQSVAFWRSVGAVRYITEAETLLAVAT
jgi:hypothetical protein